MADAQRELKIVISGDTSQAESSVGSFSESLSNVGEVAAGIGLEKLTEKIIELGKEAFKEASSLQFMRINLDNLTGSTQNTENILRGTKDLIENGIFKDSDVLSYTQKLLQMGLGQDKVNGLLHNMAAAAVGSSSSLQESSGKMTTLTNLFGYLSDKGEISVSMLGRFSKYLGIPILDTIANQLGVTTEQLGTMGSKVKITESDLSKAFQTMATNHGIFANTINQQETGIEARQNALKQKFSELSLSIIGVSDSGQVIKNGFYDKVSNAILQLIPNVDRNNQLFKDLGKILADNKPFLDHMSDMVVKIEKDLHPLWVFIDKNINPVLKLFGEQYLHQVFKEASDVLTIVEKITSALGALFDTVNKGIGSGKSPFQYIADKIQGRALGGYASGLTLVGESGPELVELPQGSYVHSNDESKGMAGGVSVTINYPQVRDDGDISKLVDAIKSALGRQNELARLGAI